MSPLADSRTSAKVSSVLLPLLFLTMTAYVAWMTIQGFRSGTMEPLSKGITFTAERKTQPFGFWAATLWNAAWIGMCLWGAIGSALAR